MAKRMIETTKPTDAEAPVAGASDPVEGVTPDALGKLLAEIEALRKRDELRDFEVKQLKAAVAVTKPVVAAKKVHPPGPWDQPEVGLTVPTRRGPGMRDEAARIAYDQNFDVQHNGVMIRMKSCGASVLIDAGDKFPRYDMPCPCGRAHHRLIKYILED